MGLVQISQWTCERRDRVEERQERGWQPDDWATVHESVPPNRDLSASEAVVVLCRPCRSDLREWITEGPAPCPEPTP